MPRLFGLFSHTQAKSPTRVDVCISSCMQKIDINLNHNPVMEHTSRQQPATMSTSQTIFFSRVSHIYWQPVCISSTVWTFWRSILPYYYYMGCKGMKKFICSSWSVLCFARCCAKRFTLKHSATKWSSSQWSSQYFFFPHCILLEKKHYVESIKAVVKLSVCRA